MSTGKFIEWSNELSVGIEEIDDQHRILVDLLNQVHEAIQKRRGAEVAGVSFSNWKNTPGCISRLKKA